MKTRDLLSIVSVSLALVLSAVEGCSPAAPAAQRTLAPTQATAPSTATRATAPTETTAPTVISSPSQTSTPSRTATPTLPALPTPSGITFKFDDGVPQDQRDAIIASAAIARAYLGDARPITVIAYADLNGQLDEVARFFNTARNSPRIFTYQQYFQSGRSLAFPDAVFIPASKSWQASPLEARLRVLPHEYFHVAQSYLTNTDGSAGGTAIPLWLVEGTADYVMYHALAKYGYYDLGAIHKERVERTRGVVSPLSTMEQTRLAEREDTRSPYNFGYLAAEMLVSIAGEQAVLKTFWENFPKYPGWQLAFKATFGMSEEVFYNRFEETRRAQFPPYCGTQGEYVAPGAGEPLAIKFVRKDPPGAITFRDSSFTFNPPVPAAYTFCVSGYPVVNITDKGAAYKLPVRGSGTVTCGGNCILLYMPQSAAPGNYTFAIELPDKRSAQVQFQHSALGP